MFRIWYHNHIWQVPPQLRCVDTYQIRRWSEECNVCFLMSDISVAEKLMHGASVTPPTGSLTDQLHLSNRLYGIMAQEIIKVPNRVCLSGIHYWAYYPGTLSCSIFSYCNSSDKDIIWSLLCIGHFALVDITETINKVPCHLVKSLQLIWRKGSGRFCLQVPIQQSRHAMFQYKDHLSRYSIPITKIRLS